MVGIIDCNNFFASCECCFDPSLIGEPIVVLSNNDGCVIARSEEAKLLGIKMGMPSFELTKILKQYPVRAFSSNYVLYGDMSRRIKHMISTFSPNVEDYSIDESFIDLSGMELTNLFQYVKNMRDKITQGSGVPVSVGVASTKTLSKIANRFSKKEFRAIGVYIIDSDQKRIDSLKETKIEDIWMIGHRISSKLITKGIRTAYDLSMVSPSWARSNFSVVLEKTVYELQGKMCIPLELKQKPNQHIASQKSFGQFLTEYEPIAEALANYVARVAEKLRKQNSVAGGMDVWLGTNTFSKTDPQYFPRISTRCDIPTDYTPSLIKKSIEALKSIYKSGFKYKRVGIMLTDIRPKYDGTLNLFHQIEREKQDKVIYQLDRINMINGRDTLRSAQQGFNRSWKMKQNHLSRKYTTKLSDIIIIN